MAAIRKELIEKRHGRSWEAPVFEFETDDGPIEVLGWDGMNEDPDNEAMPWQILEALTADGETKYVAVPDKAIEYLHLKTEAVGGDSMTDEERAKLFESMTENEMADLNARLEKEQKRVWRSFLNYGSDWEHRAFPPEIKVAQKNTAFNVRDEIMSIWQNENSPVVKIGKHCLHLADRKYNGRYLFGNGPEWTLGSVLQPYRDFLSGAAETIKKGTDCYIDTETGRFYPAGSFPEGIEAPDCRIKISNVLITKADVQKDWDKAVDDDTKIADTITHKVTGTVTVLKRDRDGNWNTAGVIENASLADIPAMNMLNGRFKKGGSIYSFVNKAFAGNTMLKTAGMTMQEGLEVGIYDFMNTLAERIGRINFASRNAMTQLLSKNNMNSGFTEAFLNAHSIEDDEESLDFDFAGADAAPDNEDEEITQEEREAVAEEARVNSMLDSLYIDEALRIRGLRGGLKGSAMYDNENNPFPRAQLTIRFDEKMNDPNLLTTYLTDSSGAPEGKNASLVGRMLSFIRVGLDGTVYKPCLTLDQLDDLDAVTPSTLKWVKAFERKGDPDTGALENSYYIRAGLVNEDGTLKVDEDGKIDAQLGENIVRINPYRVNRPVYVSPDPRCDHSAGTEQSGLPQNSKEVRTQIKTSNLKDAAPNIRTQSPSLFLNREPGIGEDLITRARMDGVIEKIEYGITLEGRNEPVGMSVRYDDGSIQTIDLRWKEKLNSKNAKRQQPCCGLKDGSRVKKDQPLTDVPGMSMGMATVGPPLVVLIGSGLGEYGTDDSAYISKRGAELLGTVENERQVEEVIADEAASPYGPTFIYNPVIGRDSTVYDGKYDCSKLDENGMVKAGEKVSTGDIVAFMAVPNGSKVRTAGEQLALQRPKPGELFTPPEDYKVVPVKVRAGVSNADVTASLTKPVNGRSKIELNYIKEYPVTTGSKGSFDGVKTVFRRAEDGDGIFIHAPGSKFDGVEVDVVETPSSGTFRSTISFYLSGLLQRAAIEKGVKIDVGVDSENVLTDTMNFLAESGLGDGTVDFYGKIGPNEIPVENMQRGLLLVVNCMNVNKIVENIIGMSAVTNSPMVQDSILADNLRNTLKAMTGTKNSRNGSIVKEIEKAATVKLGIGTVVQPGPDTRDHYNPGYSERFL